MKERHSNCLAKRIERVKSDYAPILASYQELIKASPAEYAFYLAQLKSRISEEVEQNRLPLYKSLVGRYCSSFIVCTGITTLLLGLCTGGHFLPAFAISVLVQLTAATFEYAYESPLLPLSKFTRLYFNDVSAFLCFAVEKAEGDCRLPEAEQLLLDLKEIRSVVS